MCPGLYLNLEATKHHFQQTKVFVRVYSKSQDPAASDTAQLEFDDDPLDAEGQNTEDVASQTLIIALLFISMFF